LPGPRVYEFSLARGLYEALVLLLSVCFMIWVAVGPRSTGGWLGRAFIIAVAVTPFYYLYLLLTSPRRLTLVDHAIMIRPWFGPERTWNSRDLMVRSETTWSRLWGVREVANREGRLQFRLMRGMRGYRDLCSDLEMRRDPAPRQTAED